MKYEVKILGHKKAEKGSYLKIWVPDDTIIDLKKYSDKKQLKGELTVYDNRNITLKQKNKISLNIADISDATGHDFFPMMVYLLKEFNFYYDTNFSHFKFMDISSASLFIDFIIEFVLKWNIPLSSPILTRINSMKKYLYIALKYQICSISTCGLPGETHHWDAIGMGNDRTKIDDSLKRKICLCREHHIEAHKIGKEAFRKKHQVFGVIYP